MPIVKAENLSKTYRVYTKNTGLRQAFVGLFRRKYTYVRAVRAVNFSIEKGELVGFLGPNGAGKTTTLKMLTGLVHPSDGSARVLDFIPWQREEQFRRRFALVMGQKNQLWWDLPAQESFLLNKEIYQLSHDAFQHTVDELGEILEVEQKLSTPVRELSLGERMKMELIAALLHSPEVLFLDEPTIGLDVTAQRSIRQCLARYNREKNVTIMLTSHYMRDIEYLCRRVIVINHGRIVYDGDLSGILAQFSQHKILRIRFRGKVPDRLEAIGRVIDRTGSMISIEVERSQVAQTTGRLLAEHELDDFSVEDRPIEQVIGDVFAASGPEEEEEQEVLRM